MTTWERFVGSGLMPHGHCILWDPLLLTLHVGSDLLIAIAYFSIPVALWRLVRGRPDLAFPGILQLFAGFILACGATHAISIWTTWRPMYGLEGVVKLITAGLSLATACALWPLLPKVMALPSRATLADANARLQSEISERQRAERELRTLNELLERKVRERTQSLNQVIDASPSGMLMIDERGRILRANAQIERIFGYVEEELLGRSVETLVPERARASHPELRERFFLDPRPRPMGAGRDLYGVRRDGSEVAVEIGLNPIQTQDGLRVLSSVVDITERKRAEARLEEQAAQLARSNAALEEFAYIASHDLKEPLRGIHNYASFLQEDYADKLDDAGQEKLGTLMRLTQRMNDLIDALLDYSRVGRTENAIGATAIEPIVRETLEMLAPLIEEHGVEVRVQTPLPNVVCDRVRIAEVFRNLIANAIKYRSEQAPWIEIGACDSHADTRPASSRGRAHDPVFFVRDNGIGIAEQHFETIFRMFKRLHARGERGGGVGAGLSIVKRIIELHGGTIRVRSTVGKGTEFSFSIGPAA